MIFKRKLLETGTLCLKTVLVSLLDASFLLCARRPGQTAAGSVRYQPRAILDLVAGQHTRRMLLSVFSPNDPVLRNPNKRARNWGPLGGVHHAKISLQSTWFWLFQKGLDGATMVGFFLASTTGRVEGKESIRETLSTWLIRKIAFLSPLSGSIGVMLSKAPLATGLALPEWFLWKLKCLKS